MGRGFTAKELLAEMQKRGHVVFTDGDYNLNLIGIRYGRRVTNRFDDDLYILYRVHGAWTLEAFPFTTRPGAGPAAAPRNPDGVAILAPGQYRRTWRIGMHKGKQLALVQCQPVKVFRDKNRDKVLDYVCDETGMFGINIHWSSTVYDSVQVDNWSEGCQVGAGAKNYGRFITLLQTSAEKFGDVFSYTLLDATDK